MLCPECFTFNEDGQKLCTNCRHPLLAEEVDSATINYWEGGEGKWAATVTCPGCFLDLEVESEGGYHCDECGTEFVVNHKLEAYIPGAKTINESPQRYMGKPLFGFQFSFLMGLSCFAAAMVMALLPDDSSDFLSTLTFLLIASFAVYNALKNPGADVWRCPVCEKELPDYHEGSSADPKTLFRCPSCKVELKRNL